MTTVETVAVEALEMMSFSFVIVGGSGCILAERVIGFRQNKTFEAENIFRPVYITHSRKINRLLVSLL